ncbi:MAG: ThiF family adenylyltransferase [Solidesulfovibrio sp.]|uniref:ThiF family adenylyltransferase n=1 Tax=Solidesulfovibrio sp. TaxID=2910990 RepID=UPI003158590D
MDAPQIRFAHRALDSLRSHILSDITREQFALLLGKRHEIQGLTVVTIHDVRFPQPDECRRQTIASVSPTKGFVYRILAETQRRLDVDTIIDVHTHPFTDTAWFSGTDDKDERKFCKYLNETVEGIHYGSIVLSRKAYQARLWVSPQGEPSLIPAIIKAQTATESIREGSAEESSKDYLDLDHVQSRSALALGLDTLRQITHGQFIVLAGVGGLGSVMAEHLVHQGFPHIGLIDNDRLELSNLNRFVGARYEDAVSNRLKVDVVAEHLRGINPEVLVDTLATEVGDSEAQAMMARADWILLSTDNHASRYIVQKTALTYFVPMISAGVNISVEPGTQNPRLIDRSGEVIVVRTGDGYCLNCLGRINMAQVTAESHPDPQVRGKTVARGYVQGLNVKEPAVKTLNALISSLAVERLVDQYCPSHTSQPILVYESHNGACLYQDADSLYMQPLGCGHCLLP